MEFGDSEQGATVTAITNPDGADNSPFAPLTYLVWHMYPGVQPPAQTLQPPHSTGALYEWHEPTGVGQRARQKPQSPPQRRDRKRPPQNAEGGLSAHH